MIEYSISITLNKDIKNEWLLWMKEEHIKDVMNTGCFTGWELKKLLLPENAQNESTYVTGYSLQSINLYNEYLEKAAPILQKKHSDKFGGKFRASRAVYKVIK